MGAVVRGGNNYPPELRECAVRMVAEVRSEYPSDRPAIVAVAQRLGIGSAETLRKWARRAGRCQCPANAGLSAARPARSAAAVMLRSIPPNTTP
jgi:transposase-like protein